MQPRMVESWQDPTHPRHPCWDPRHPCWGPRPLAGTLVPLAGTLAPLMGRSPPLMGPSPPCWDPCPPCWHSRPPCWDPRPGHVRKDDGRSHPPDAPCPAQVCTSAPLAGLRAPHSSAPHGFTWGPRHTAHLARCSPGGWCSHPLHLTPVASAASHRAPHTAP